MTDQDLLVAKLEELSMAFPNVKIEPATIAVYAKRLSAMPTESVCAAIDRLMDTARFFPTIGEIKEAAVAGPFGLDLADEAWAEVVREAKRVGFNRPPVFRNGRFEAPPAPEFSSPLIAQAVNAIGWESICTSDKPEIVAAQFRKAFNALLERQTKARQTGALPLDGTVLTTGNGNALGDGR